MRKASYNEKTKAAQGTAAIFRCLNGWLLRQFHPSAFFDEEPRITANKNAFVFQLFQTQQGQSAITARRAHFSRLLATFGDGKAGGRGRSGYYINLIEGPYLEAAPEICKTFRPKKK
jgi:hypothetical protein